MADYHPLEVVGLSPATLHLVTWIGLRFGLGPGRRSGPGLRLGLRCGLPYTANLARLTLTLTRTLTLTQTLTLTLTLTRTRANLAREARSLPKVLGPPTRAPPPPMRSAAYRLALALALALALGLGLGLGLGLALALALGLALGLGLGIALGLNGGYGAT